MRPRKPSNLSVFFTLVLMILVCLPVTLVGQRCWGAGDTSAAAVPSTSQLSSATENAPAVTRWTAPQNQPKPIHPAPSDSGPSQIIRLTPTTRGPIPRLGDQPTGPAGRIALVVHQDIYDSISDSLDQYEADLAAMGYGVVTLSFSGTAEALRSTLVGLYGEPETLVGAVLVGEIPYVVFEMYDDFRYDDQGKPILQYTDFPCDLYFMDLNGQWADSLNDGDIQAGNDKYDTWTGDRNLEIWVCRLKVDNLTDLNVDGSSSVEFQSDVLTSYLDRNHRYRVGNMIPSDAGLVYDDDPWQGLAGDDAKALSLVFGESNVLQVSIPENTTRADYLENRLPTAPQIVFLRSHGYTGGHVFDPDPFVLTEDYRNVDPQTPFFSLYVCYGSDYAVDNNLAGTIVFNPEGSGLFAWGSSKEGGMWNDEPFYSAMAAGEVFGEAFRRWYNEMSVMYPPPSDKPHIPQFTHKWWGGMVLIGDAALKPLIDASPTGSLTVTLTPPEAAAAGAKWSVDGVNWKISGETLPGLCMLGEHTIQFLDTPGWITPQRQRVGFRNGPHQSASSNYMAANGMLVVSISPQDAINAGAQWSIDGDRTWHNPGVPVSVPIGPQTVTFRQIEGWRSPESQSVTIGSGSTAQVEVTYNALIEGMLVVSISPQHAVNAGAQWSLDGGQSWHNPGAPVSVPLGPQTVTFRQIEGWSSPESQSVSIGSDSTTQVEVTYNPLLSADFTASVTSGKVPLRVSFQDNTSGFVGGPQKWLWDFGDGGKSTRQNPTYAYRRPGSYTVRLTVTFADGTTRTRSYANYITPYTAPRANFTFSPTRVRVGQVAFTDKSTGTVVSRSWSLGNGQTSSEQNPVTTYDTPGRRTVTLTVNGPGGSSSTISRAINVLP